MVEELKVDPGDLDSAAGRLTSLSGDNAQTETYLNQWLDLPRSEGGLVLSGVIDAQPREQVVIPDEPDDDDLYFQQRNQRGWLE